MVKWLSAVVLVGGLVGCGDDGSSTPVDSGAVGVDRPGVDGGGMTDAGGPAGERGFGPICRMPPCAGAAPILQTADCKNRDDCIDADDATLINAMEAMPADFSCMGTRTAPTPGASGAFTLQINDFQEGNPTPDVCVEVYPDNMVPTGGATCMGDMTNAMGQLMATANAGGWYAYRVFPRPDPVPADAVVGSVQYNEPAPAAGGMSEGVSISGSTIALIPTILGFMRTSGTAVLAGTITDCADNPVYGARIEVVLPDGSRVQEGDRNPEPHYRYFDGTDFPSSRQPWTHIDGLYAVANIAPSAEPVRVEVFGRTAVGDPMTLIACEEGVLIADTGTILNIGPLRSDGPCEAAAPPP